VKRTTEYCYNFYLSLHLDIAGGKYSTATVGYITLPRSAEYTVVYASVLKVYKTETKQAGADDSTAIIEWTPAAETYDIVAGPYFEKVGEVTLLISREGEASLSIVFTDGESSLAGVPNPVKFGVYGDINEIPYNPALLPGSSGTRFAALPLPIGFASITGPGGWLPA